MRRRHPLLPTSLAAAVALAVLVAGCGGGSSPGVASVGGSSSTSSTSPSSAGPPSAAQLAQDQRDATRFARCMRSHGVANFPGPTVAPRAFKNAFSNPTPAFQSADAACGHLMPARTATGQPSAHTRTQTEALLAFARCLRARGFSSFPDPDASGELTHQMLARAGIQLHDPTLLQAADACTSVTHGVITRSVIAQFVAGH